MHTEEKQTNKQQTNKQTNKQQTNTYKQTNKQQYCAIIIIILDDVRHTQNIFLHYNQQISTPIEHGA